MYLLIWERTFCHPRKPVFLEVFLHLIFDPILTPPSTKNIAALLYLLFRLLIKYGLCYDRSLRELFLLTVKWLSPFFRTSVPATTDLNLRFFNETHHELLFLSFWWHVDQWFCLNWVEACFFRTFLLFAKMKMKKALGSCKHFQTLFPSW